MVSIFQNEPRDASVAFTHYLLDATTMKIQTRGQRNSGGKHVCKEKDCHSTDNGIRDGRNDSSKLGKDSQKYEPRATTITGTLRGTFCLQIAIQD